MIPTSKSTQKRKPIAPRGTEQAPPSAGQANPVALVSRYAVHRCRECGEPIKEGDRVWWVRESGTAHLTCGWTMMKSGSVHPATVAYIKDIPVARAAKAVPTIEEKNVHLFSSGRQMPR